MMARPALMSTGMYFSVLATKLVWSHTNNMLAVFLASIAIGVLSYGVLVVLFSRPAAREALDIFKPRTVGGRT
jgi:hypothetical protein